MVMAGTEQKRFKGPVITPSSTSTGTADDCSGPWGCHAAAGLRSVSSVERSGAAERSEERTDARLKPPIGTGGRDRLLEGGLIERERVIAGVVWRDCESFGL